MQRLLCLLLVMIFTASVTAQTTTPAVPVTTPPAKDIRLDKKVSLSFNSGKLEDILASMSKSASIDFAAGNNERDWRVRERKVTIYAKDMPVGTVMDELAKLLGYRVSRQGKENQWSYLIWQDLKSKQLEEEMVTAAKAAASDRSTRLRQSALDTAEAALGMSQEDAMKLKDTNPWLAYLGGTASGRGFANLMSGINQNSPVERDLMLRGQGVSVSLDTLPGSIMDAANTSITGGIGGMMHKMRQGQMDNVRPSQVNFMPIEGGEPMDGIAGMGGMAVITGRTPDGGEIPLGIFPMTNGNSMVGNVFGKMFFALDEGKSMADAEKQVQSETSNPDFMAEMLARESPTEKNPPTDPSLTREIEIKDISKDISQAQSEPSKMKEYQGKMIEEISRAFGMPVILEAFSSSLPIGPFVKPGKQPLYKVLIAFEKSGYIWEQGNGTFRVRPEDWALQRSYEISDAFIQKYKEILANQGAFTLEDIAGMAYELTDDQIQNNLAKDPDLAYALQALLTTGGSRGLLRVYGSLNNQQRVAIKSEQGLSFQQLSNNGQWDRLSAFITDKAGGAYINGGSIRLIPQSIDTNKSNSPEAAQMGAMNVAIFEITLQVNDEQKPRTLRDGIPMYSKQQLEMMRKMQKSAQEAAMKANEKKATTAPVK